MPGFSPDQSTSPGCTRLGVAMAAIIQHDHSPPRVECSGGILRDWGPSREVDGRAGGSDAERGGTVLLSRRDYPTTPPPLSKPGTSSSKSSFQRRSDPAVF